jgi:nicotinamidase-related amidase
MTSAQSSQELPVPPQFDPQKVGQVWRVPYQQRAREARQWAVQTHIQPASSDVFKIALIGIDIQNTFCIPEFELYVAGRSGNGAIDDNRRLCEFIYRNLNHITEISATMDTHQAFQIFHPVYLIDAHGNHPDPLTVISAEDIQKGQWMFNPAVANSLGIDPNYGQEHLKHYVEQLKSNEKYELTIWPYHAMLGGIGHALVAAFEEALFFHSIARSRQADIILKGDNPLTESYSAVGPEVQRGPHGEEIAHKSGKLYGKLEQFDAVIIAGQAKSHCVAWTISDLLADIQANDGELAEKVYLLEDCTSPVVVPGVVDYSKQADEAFEKFVQAGMRLIRSDVPLNSWPGIQV